jgi:hypothetical protein
MRHPSEYGDSGAVGWQIFRTFTSAGRSSWAGRDPGTGGSAARRRRTGTILFTVYERVRASSDETPWYPDRKLGAMKVRLLEQAAGKLAEQVVSKVRRLAAPPAAS